MPVGRLSRSTVVLALAMLVGRTAAADDSESRLEQAKGAFREGVSLLNAGDPQRALESFLRSRELVPSGKNTANAAICLERLGRYDEALELYEELLSRFAKDLDEQDRQNLAPTMATLRERLASLDLSANVEGSLIVDGKPRGKLPRTTPLRVLPGKRRVRIVKEGYRTFETVVELRAGQTEAVDAELEPLAGLGAIRIEETGGSGGELVIDGTVIGKTPWEGTLPTGTHLMQVLGASRGSVPETIRVAERRTLLLRVPTRALGPTLRVVAEPKTAELLLGKQALGRGEWVGRLPLGSYRFHARERGYFDATSAVVVSKASPTEAITLALVRDPEHSRWPQPRLWFPSAGVNLGMLFAPTLNGGAEGSCPSLCARGPSALGANFEAELAVEHRQGVGARLAGGYAFAGQDFSRAIVERYQDVDLIYALHQELVLGGPYGRLAAFAKAPLPLSARLHGEMGFGLLAATYEAAASGAAWTTADYVPAAAVGLDSISEIEPFVSAKLGVERAFGPVVVSVAADAWFFPGEGPKFTSAELVVQPDCPQDAALESVGCVPASKHVADEPVHGPFWFVSPVLGARYRF